MKKEVKSMNFGHIEHEQLSIVESSNFQILKSSNSQILKINPHKNDKNNEEINVLSFDASRRDIMDILRGK